MVFSSIEFLFGFLPLTLALYFVLPWTTAKNVVLLVVSLLFYAWGEPVYVFLMMASIALNWAFALLIARAKGRAVRLVAAGRQRDPSSGAQSFEPSDLVRYGEDDGFDSLAVTPATEAYIEGDAKKPSREPVAARVFFILALVFNLGLLAVFKYAGFVAAQLGRFFANVPALDIALPIGISFYTLQTVSYIIDVWRGRVRAQRNILYLGMYIAMFPQLIAGPIVRYAEIWQSIRQRHTTLAAFSQGMRLFIVGLGKKVLLANCCGLLADSLLVRQPSTMGFVGCASAVVAYTFQIYFDFGGYSDMAIGLGRMFGFSYPRNFNYPYISASVTEFWHRWHMTLGSFFRDYLYIPLGGNRVSKPRWMLNIFIVWSLTGLWHGAAWNFVIWGLYYGLLLMAEKLFLLKVLRRLPRWVGHLYAIVVFMIGWAIFAVGGGLSNLGQWFLGLFGAYGLLGTSTFFELMSWSYVSVFGVCAVAATPVVPWARKRLEAWLQRDATGAGGAAGVRGIALAKEPAAPERGNGMPPLELCISEPLSRGRAFVAAVISVMVDGALLCIFVSSVLAVVSSGYNPFIYFQF